MNNSAERAALLYSAFDCGHLRAVFMESPFLYRRRYRLYYSGKSICVCQDYIIDCECKEKLEVSSKLLYSQLYRPKFSVGVHCVEVLLHHVKLSGKSFACGVERGPSLLPDVAILGPTASQWAHNALCDYRHHFIRTTDQSSSAHLLRSFEEPDESHWRRVHSLHSFQRLVLYCCAVCAFDRRHVGSGDRVTCSHRVSSSKGISWFCLLNIQHLLYEKTNH